MPRARLRTSSRKRVGALALAAVASAVIVGAVLWRARHAEPGEADPRERAAERAAGSDRARDPHALEARAEAPPGGRAQDADAGRTSEGLPAGPDDRGQRDPGPGQEHVDRYQGRSGRLSPHADPHGTRATTPIRSHMAAPNVIAWVPSVAATIGEEVVLGAAVIGGEDEIVEPETIEATFFRSDPSDGVTVAMRRATRERAAQWEVGYVPTAEAHPIGADGAPPLVRWTVRARGTYEGERYSRSASGLFHVSSPGARLDTGRARAERSGTDLVVRVPVVIERPGTYYGYAELWGGEDAATPIAFARDRVRYERAGEQVFTFLFGGAVIRERGIDGPYVVRNMRFMQVDSIPPHEQAPVEEVLTTPDWPVSGFE